jgi:hypothetical protein
MSAILQEVEGEMSKLKGSTSKYLKNAGIYLFLKNNFSFKRIEIVSDDFAVTS